MRQEEALKPRASSKRQEIGITVSKMEKYWLQRVREAVTCRLRASQGDTHCQREWTTDWFVDSVSHATRRRSNMGDVTALKQHVFSKDKTRKRETTIFKMEKYQLSLLFGRYRKQRPLDMASLFTDRQDRLDRFYGMLACHPNCLYVPTAAASVQQTV
ncbi:hypothetical protein O0L34_g16170 [Tuta absoluta]|nr:hypothetical protein O0L34_g16170 [Tuta absoluta]